MKLHTILSNSQTLLILLCFNSLVSVGKSEFLSVTGSIIAGIGASVYGGWSAMKCRFYECCDEPWVNNSLPGLNNEFKTKLHGQHLVQEITWKLMKSHLTKNNPQKALVLSFHGWTGTGKNFVSKMIAESMFKKGMSSSFVKLFICSYDFPFHEERDIRMYKQKIQEKVKSLVSACGSALIIFDEVDKAPPGVLDAIKPFIDFHESVDGIDYRRATFIFLSNAGGNAVSEKVYEFWKSGIRDSITLLDVERNINVGVFNEDGGMKGMEIIDKSLISAFIPFLPLERKHIKLCIRDEMKSRGKRASDELINKIADQLEYYPPDTEAFSKTGCKRVPEKVDLFMDADS